MGEHFDRELKIMRMVESLIIHNPDMETPQAVKRATHFVDLQARRFDQADVRDYTDKFDKEK